MNEKNATRLKNATGWFLVVSIGIGNMAYKNENDYPEWHHPALAVVTSAKEPPVVKQQRASRFYSVPQDSIATDSSLILLDSLQENMTDSLGRDTLPVKDTLQLVDTLPKAVPDSLRR